ncbi:hypothetical protein GZ77_26210 [Endozoicomonas montiporae]|uniref:Uncharacterized protein n=1 Tax=Endozoicomonas montiporae TaxID=1027273 RepID=A0A081MYN0_9GAMM|nr:hypothetical protein [Endozoicomonas montiporae]KEQ11244.1 hypothetical protein GZ77_26465 [Endozoicomonas montiporae]KEQ11303.1 hypothetical protein GZ77_26210 [Endozoicomonas montiporae]
MITVKPADDVTEQYWSSRKYKKWGVRLEGHCMRQGKVSEVKYVRAQTPAGAALIAESACTFPVEIDYVQLASPQELGAVNTLEGVGYA